MRGDLEGKEGVTMREDNERKKGVTMRGSKRQP